MPPVRFIIGGLGDKVGMESKPPSHRTVGHGTRADPQSLVILILTLRLESSTVPGSAQVH